jgi:hypothetical protein
MEVFEILNITNKTKFVDSGDWRVEDFAGNKLSGPERFYLSSKIQVN